jgi:hypothetical protein
MQRVFVHRPLGIDDRLERLVLDANPLGGAARLLGMLRGHERNGLAEVAHAFVGEHRLVLELEPVALLTGNVFVREHRVHTAHSDRGGDVDRHDARVCVRAAYRVAPEHPCRLQVAGVGEFACDFRNPVDARHAVTDTSELQPRCRGLAHRPFFGR